MSSDPDRSEVVEVLVAQHREFLAFLQRRVRDPETAEDLLQDAFVRGIARVGQLRDDESAVAWFYRSLRNAVIDHYRRRGASQHKLDTIAREWPELMDATNEAARAVCACVTQLAATLRPEYGDALRAVDVEGTPVNEFAADHGLTANNASVRLHRARNALRTRVKETCGSCATHGCLDCECQQSLAPR